MIKSLQAINLIDMKFPGGMRKFLEKAGLCYIPDPTSSEGLMYIVHPELPEELKRDLINLFGERVIFGSKCNFDWATANDILTIQDSINSIMKDFNLGDIVTTINPAVVVITIPNLSKDDEKTDKIIEAFIRIQGVIRGCILCSDGFRTFEGQEVDRVITKSVITPMQTGRPTREKVISSDDLLNIKIALETANTIEELIAQL